MEVVASASLKSFRSFPVRPPTFVSKDYSSSFSLIRYSSRKPSCIDFKFHGSHLPTIRLQPSSLAVAAVVGDRTVVPNDSSTEHTSLTEQPFRGANHEVPKNGEEKNDEDLSDHLMVRVCDKLIEVFMVDKTTPTDWRKLLAYSKDWTRIRPHFYKRCQDRADNEDDPGMKHNLLRLQRKLKVIDEDVQRHDELLQVVKSAHSEIGEVVARRRKDFTQEFFVHLLTVAQSYHDNTLEQDVIAKLGETCLAAVQAYDTATENIEALNAAELKFEDIMNSPSVDAACRKIDNLVEKNKLDSAMMLLITKAWSAGKETDMMKDEAKDILFHLYMKSMQNLERLVPKEIRIIKILLMIEDPERRLCTLKDALTPGEEIEGDVDSIYTTPEKLHTSIKSVIDAYHFSREGTLIKEARDLMDPKIIQKMEELKKLLQDNFM